LETMRRLAIELGLSLPSDPDYAHAQVKEN
jgi:hypothetical protein